MGIASKLFKRFTSEYNVHLQKDRANRVESLENTLNNLNSRTPSRELNPK